MSLSLSKNNLEAVHFFKELRTRLIYSLIIFMLLLALAVYDANHLYTLLARPLLKFLPEGHLIATQIVSPFFAPFKLAFLVAVLLTAPFFIYQLWHFIAPALYRSERKIIWPFLLVSAALFYAGITFAYFVILPMLFRFLANVAPIGVVFTPDINAYLDFTIKLLLIFGALFEIPIIMLVLVLLKVVTRAQLVKWRSYAIVAAFILGMLFAPPDVMSQTILAVPIWLLYEAGLIMTTWVKTR